MRVERSRYVTGALVMLASCGSDTPTPAQNGALTPQINGCTEDLVWQQGSGANSWWVEYSIANGTVASADLEVVGVGNVPLSFMWNKWVGPTGFPIATGADVIVHAQNSDGDNGQTVTFGYLVDTAPLSASCPGECIPECTDLECGDDGCGGSCGTCPDGFTCVAGTCSSCAVLWDPAWQQASGANNWWVEYTITDGTVASADLEVVGVGNVPLTSMWGKWVGPTGFYIATGADVVLHAENSFDQEAQTEIFGYLVDTQPLTQGCAAPCEPSCDGRECGDDGCGGTCGSCEAGEQCVDGVCSLCDGSWQPSFAQGSGANEWWVEYSILDGTVASAYLEVVDVGTVPLSFQWNKWVGPTPARIPTGTQVRVHAEDSEGRLAQTVVFPYLVELQPEVEPCLSPPPCEPPLTQCDGLCSNLDLDASNCGSCGNVCPATAPTCNAGVCSCDAPYTQCEDVCANLDTDVNNCGACGNVCTSTTGAPICVAGTCGSVQPPTCAAGSLSGVLSALTFGMFLLTRLRRRSKR